MILIVLTIQSEAEENSFVTNQMPKLGVGIQKNCTEISPGGGHHIA